MDNFFYNMNQKLKQVLDTPKTEHKQLNERAETDESALQAYLGKKKYGEAGMKALQKAGREGASEKTMDRIRDQHDKMDEGSTGDYSAKKARAGKDIGKPGKNFAKIEKSAGGGAKGKRIAGAVLKNLRAKEGEVEEGWDDMMKDVEKRRGQMKTGEKIRGHKGEIEKTATGIKHTRSYDPKTGETDTDDGEGQPQKKGRGRPKGAKKAIGAKGPSGKSKLMNKEASHDDNPNIAKAKAILQKAGYKVTKDEEELDEKAVSKKQQRFMGMVHAAQKGEKPASKEVAKVAKSMKKKDAEDFAATKHKGLPEKKGKAKEEVGVSDYVKAFIFAELGLRGLSEEYQNKIRGKDTKFNQIQNIKQKVEAGDLSKDEAKNFYNAIKLLKTKCRNILPIFINTYICNKSAHNCILYIY